MERGQASLEYVAVAAVLACTLAVAGAASGAERIPRAVAAQVERAFCIVASGDCDGDEGPRPCVRSADARTREKRYEAAVVRLSGGRTLLREDRSDGSVAVTLADADELVGGPDVGVKVGGRDARGVVRAMAGARLTAGRRWVVADGAAADRLMRRLDRDPGGIAGVGGAVADVVRFLATEDDADERFATFGVRGQATAALKAFGFGGDAELLGGFTQGIRVDRAGTRTLMLARDSALSADLSAQLARVTGGLERDTRVELTFDRDGGPLALTVVRTGSVQGEAKLGPQRVRGGNLVEAQARLDLRDPQARALLGDALDRARRADPRAVGAAVALGRRLAERARIDVRLYATSRTEKSRGTSVLGVGAETLDVTERGRLVAAFGREPGQGWARRLDCKLA